MGKVIPFPDALERERAAVGDALRSLPIVNSEADGFPRLVDTLAKLMVKIKAREKARVPSQSA
jgi:hypothetical protein